MRNTGTGWTSVKEALPGLGQDVFVYSEHEKSVDGPVRLVPHLGTELKEHRGTEYTQGHGSIDRYEGIGIYGLAWFKGSGVFTRFMPSHWTLFPELPASGGD